MRNTFAVALTIVTLIALGVMCWLLVLAGTGAMIPVVLTLAAVPLWTLANTPNQPGVRDA